MHYRTDKFKHLNTSFKLKCKGDSLRLKAQGDQIDIKKNHAQHRWTSVKWIACGLVVLVFGN